MQAKGIQRRLSQLSGHVVQANFSSVYRKHPLYEIEESIEERSIVLTPKTETKYALIWLHGLGDSAHGFANLFLEKESSFTPPSCKVVLLTAPERPVTLNGGMMMNSWYDIYSLRGDHIKSLDDLYSKYSREEMMESVGIVSRRLDREIELLKGESTKVFVGGFSQGCALSFATMTHYPKQLGGVIGLSGMNAIKIDWASVPKERKATPICIHHGEDDDMINHKIALRTYQEYLDNGFTAMEIKTEAGLGHHMSLPEINRLRSYLSKLMP